MSLIATYYSRLAVCSSETRVTRVRNRPFASRRSTTTGTTPTNDTQGRTKKDSTRLPRGENSPGAESPSPRDVPFRANQLHSRPAALFLVNTKRHRELWGFHEPSNGSVGPRSMGSKRWTQVERVTSQKKIDRSKLNFLSFLPSRGTSTHRPYTDIPTYTVQNDIAGLLMTFRLGSPNDRTNKAGWAEETSENFENSYGYDKIIRPPRQSLNYLFLTGERTKGFDDP